MTMKIDPYNITNFNRTEEELQLFLLFCIVVAGKTAYIQADKLEQFLNAVNQRLMMPEHVKPFQTILSAEQHGILMQEIQNAKLGQYRKIYAGFKYISENKFDLNNMTPDQLELIPGVGMKSKLEFLKIVFNDAAWRIIFGPWAFLVHVVLVLKSILIAAVPMAKKVGQLLMKIDILKFGT